VIVPSAFASSCVVALALSQAPAGLSEVTAGALHVPSVEEITSCRRDHEAQLQWLPRRAGHTHPRLGVFWWSSVRQP
jgi:hypothetical protein